MNINGQNINFLDYGNKNGDALVFLHGWGQNIEMMQMLNLIHAENQYIFEILRASLLAKDMKDDVTYDDYDKEYKRIIKSLEKYSYCSDCSYKNRFEKMRNIIKEKDEKRK